MVVGLLGATAVMVAGGCGSRPESQIPASPASEAGATPFAWFLARPAPAGWQSLELPDATATLSIPPDATPVPGDPGSVSAVVTGPNGELRMYLNATPQEGEESLSNWPGFRLAHLTGENAASADRLSDRTGVPFRGGLGSCVEDTYVTRIGSHVYREIACLVAGTRGGSVLVVAAPAGSWDRDSAVLEEAVDSYNAE
ncbi:hypothetical protein [Arthrobacter sp. NicSoilB8]|uniref:hypothetical protein n=1 Tax=Arthrobacter sp. NicSoilB8 TaxID=2830998 RepID=UPI001CC704AB|nr:hypothetical protein [Arthrobacter sp. NicSoilB8]BCW71067.1 hypothetical protein NicSoilB8_21110 [Arthrobacter sp. NicSoilB8]